MRTGNFKNNCDNVYGMFMEVNYSKVYHSQDRQALQQHKDRSQTQQEQLHGGNSTPMMTSLNCVCTNRVTGEFFKIFNCRKR